jgi:hypothetical protein
LEAAVAGDKSIDNWRVLVNGYAGGRHVVNIPLPVTSGTVVAVSAAERSNRRPVVVGKASASMAEKVGSQRFIGLADVWVSNVATRGIAGQGDGYVELVLHIDGIDEESPIEVSIDISRLHSDKPTEIVQI